MIGWGITHAHSIGLVAAGFMAGVVFAAWRQLQLEKVEDDEWVRNMRRAWKTPA